MAMTKAEKARLEELETALALAWPSYPEPRPMTREEIKASMVPLPPVPRGSYRRSEAALGWFCNAYNGDISQGWSDGAYHSRHNITGDSASQNMGCMYRTKREAAMALRHQMSREFARRLAAVDHIVREESA